MENKKRWWNGRIMNIIFNIFGTIAWITLISVAYNVHSSAHGGKDYQAKKQQEDAANTYLRLYAYHEAINESMIIEKDLFISLLAEMSKSGIAITALPDHFLITAVAGFILMPEGAVIVESEYRRLTSIAAKEKEIQEQQKALEEIAAATKKMFVEVAQELNKLDEAANQHDTPEVEDAYERKIQYMHTHQIMEAYERLRHHANSTGNDTIEKNPDLVTDLLCYMNESGIIVQYLYGNQFYVAAAEFFMYPEGEIAIHKLRQKYGENAMNRIKLSNVR